MAYPDFPPPEQFAVYGTAGELLSGTTENAGRPDGGYGPEPTEFLVGNPLRWDVKPGWFALAGLEAWIAANPGYDPENPGGGGEEPEEPGDPEPTDLQLAVAQFMDSADDPDLLTLAMVHTDIMVALVKAYTRGRGFGEDGTPNESVRAVIVTATARLMANPEQLDTYVAGAGVRGGFVGFSLPEQIVLNQFRKRSA